MNVHMQKERPFFESVRVFDDIMLVRMLLKDIDNQEVGED